MLIAYLVTATTFLAVDALWLSQVAFAWYQREVGALLRSQPDLAAAAALYAIVPAGIVALAVRPALAEGSWGGAIWRGALLGLTAYATFDLTNLAVLKGWPVWLSVVDMAWGTLLSATAAAAGYLAGAWDQTRRV